MLNNDSGNPYLLPDLNVSLLGTMFAMISDRESLSKDVVFPSFANFFQEWEFRLNTTNEQLGLIDIYRPFHSIA